MFILNYETLIAPFLKDIRAFIAQFADLNPGDGILDVCCETGVHVFKYAQWSYRCRNR